MVSRLWVNVGVAHLKGTRDIPLLTPVLLQYCASLLSVSAQPRSGDSLDNLNQLIRTYTSTVLPISFTDRAAHCSCAHLPRSHLAQAHVTKCVLPSRGVLEPIVLTRHDLIADSRLIKGTHELGYRSTLYNTLHGLPTTRLLKSYLPDMYSRYPLVSEYQVQTLRLRREKSRCAPHHSLHRIHPLAAPCKLVRSQTKRNKIQHSPQRRNKRASEKPTNQLRQKTKQLPSFSLPTEINHLGKKKIGGLARVEGEGWVGKLTRV